MKPPAPNEPPAEREGSSRSIVIAGLLLVVATSPAYSNSFGSPFVFDDSGTALASRAELNAAGRELTEALRLNQNAGAQQADAAKTHATTCTQIHSAEPSRATIVLLCIAKDPASHPTVIHMDSSLCSE